MSKTPEFDPQAIPNFGGGGRIGEIDPNEREEQQSSAQIAPGIDVCVPTDPAAAVAPDDPADDAALEADFAHRPVPPVENPRTLRDDRARGETHVHTDNPEPPLNGARCRA